jgi:protein-tyrosine-phosphatase/predicted ATP-grasp superfamily ATP-dependent carboligase
VSGRGTSGRVLVLGDDNRSCLTVVRSLGRAGLEVWLGTEAPDSIVPLSRYVRKTVPLPPTAFRVEEWVSQLRTLLERESFDLVIPTSDNALVPIASRRAIFEPLARLAMPDQTGFECSYSKEKTLALAERVGVPIPPTIAIESAAGLRDIQSNPRFPFPLILKPVSSKVWSGGKRFDLKVRTARDWKQLESSAAQMLSASPILVQARVPGIGVGQEFLASEGRIVDAFQHERVHEPLAGGGSSYRKSVALDERMLEGSRRLLADLRWTGVAMVEYKRNPDTGDFALMEINGRFWGSLPLAVAAGVDFPHRLYLMLTGHPVPASAPYRLDVYGRNLGKDLGWFQERVGSGKAATLSLLAREIFTGLRNALAGRERVDTITLDDPIPGLSELWHGVVSPVRKLGRRIKVRLERTILAFVAARPTWRVFQRRKLRRRIAADPRILFVCRGNICRSPFAQAYADIRFAERGSERIQTRSAGSYPVEDRPSPPEARDAGREFGIDLEAHRSRALSSSLVKWAGAILCMDERDRRELRAYPEASGKVFFLGSFDTKIRPLTIADPWSRPAEEYRACYREIVASVDGLAEALKD